MTGEGSEAATEHGSPIAQALKEPMPNNISDAPASAPLDLAPIRERVESYVPRSCYEANPALAQSDEDRVILLAEVDRLRESAKRSITFEALRNPDEATLEAAAMRAFGRKIPGFAPLTFFRALVDVLEARG